VITLARFRTARPRRALVLPHDSHPIGRVMNFRNDSMKRAASTALLICFALLPVASLRAQQGAPGAPLFPQPTDVQRVELVAGRSLPLVGTTTINKVTVANPLIADVVVISETEVVINGILAGETDIILWSPTAPRRHYRVIVRSSPERRQILVSIKFAEVRRDALREIATSVAKDFEPSTGVRAGQFAGGVVRDSLGRVLLQNARFLTVLSNFNTRTLLGLLDAQETRGNARFLAEPNLMAANREDATFLAGGEIPIPVVQGGGAGGGQQVVIQFREYGIRLTFNAEVLSDSLIKLKLRPEVSSLDFANSIILSGFRIPALRTRKIESTVDVLAGRSLIVSGLFNDEREQVVTGIPWLVKIPIIGQLFASNRWVKNESELIIVVTPVLMDPNNPRDNDLLRFRTDSTIPAEVMLKKRLDIDSTSMRKP
jgi:Flp pilus assembly secretin CpaC